MIKFRRIWLLFVPVLLHTSCSKDFSSQDTTSLEVNLLDITFDQDVIPATNEDKGTISRAASFQSQASLKQEINIPLDDGMSMTLEWSDEQLSNQNTENTDQSATNSTFSRAAIDGAREPTSWKLSNGIKFRLLTYNSGGDMIIDTVYTVGQNTNAGLPLNAGEEYAFVAYSILSKTDVPAAPLGKLDEAVISTISGDMSFVYFTKKMRLSSGKNPLNISMKHRFSQISTTIDASAIGSISSLKVRVDNHYLAPMIKLSNGKVLHYNQKTASGKALAFNLSTKSKLAKDSTIVCYDGQSASTLIIDEITINNITKRGITVPNVKLAPGTRYLLTLKLNSFTADEPPGIELGNSIYASGNLVYDRSTGTYSFAEKGEGDYWFKNFLKPRRQDLDNKDWGENNQRPKAELNGGSGDPCTKVLPTNTWRLPNREEMNNIRSATEAQVKGHPGPNIYAPVRYVEERYQNSDKRGMYFGTQTKPSDREASKYLFIPFEGIYNDNKYRNDVNTTGWYMLTNEGKFEYMQIGPNIYTFNFYTLDQNTAVSIRCVRAN